LFGELLSDVNAGINHPAQERFQRRELFVWYTERHFKLQIAIELYGNSVSLQNQGPDFSTAVIVRSIVPLDRRRIGKLKISADKNVRGASLVRIVIRWNRVEAELKDLTTNRITAIDKLGFEGEFHRFPERCASAAARDQHSS
jgi:hypothetical protein